MCEILFMRCYSVAMTCAMCEILFMRCYSVAMTCAMCEILFMKCYFAVYVFLGVNNSAFLRSCH